MSGAHHEFESLDWLEVLNLITNSATSATAKSQILETKPLSNAEEAQKVLHEIMTAAELLGFGERPFMESLDFYYNWFTRLKKNAVLKTLEIKDVRSFLIETLALREVLKNSNSSWAQDCREVLIAPEEPLSAIDNLITPHGDIRMDASEALYRLSKEKESLIRQVQQTLDRLVNDHDMANFLQERYVTTREGRWVLPIKGGMKPFINGVVHATSQTKQTVFMEPEAIIPSNNRLRQIEAEIEEEIERLLVEISNYLYGHVFAFERSRDILERADVRFAQAQFCQKIEASDFEFSTDEILLLEVKHPLLKVTDQGVVSNNVQLSPEKSILLLSGPNAGGKTVLLKSIGLAAQMARCGMPICAAPGSRIPYFNRIVTGIGDSQSVGEHLSTFAAHLKVLQQAAELKGIQNLILVDEICGSTDPEEGSALARSFIEQFSENGIYSVTTSHLSPLKSGWDEKSKVINGSMEYDTKTGKPTYKFLLGIAGDSMAIQTAKRVGVKPHLIERAMELLSPATRARLAGLDEIENLKSELNRLRDILNKDMSKAQAMRSKYEGLMEQFNKEKDEWLNREVKKAERKVEELIQQAKVDNVFKKHSSTQELKFNLPEIVKGNKGVQINNPLSSNIATPEEFGKRFPPGTKVFVPSLNQDGLIQSTPNSKGEVMILSNSIRLALPWTQLRPPTQAPNANAQIVRRSGSVTVAIHDAERTVDLRGQTVDDALSNLELELDRAAEQKEDRIKVIHGHGTEALKKAVRVYLSRSMYVKKWKAANADQGGDGVTWVELTDGN